jgi:hypothetical protein
LFHDSNAA